ncbi:MAG: FAD-dependent oxidoreductase, partial [Cyanobacteria bacterium J06634_6]
GLWSVQTKAPRVERPPNIETEAALEKYFATHFEGAWANYADKETPAGELCLNYGRLPGDRFMINWPHRGNDYGVNLHRLIGSDAEKKAYEREARWHSQAFACYIQRQLGEQYGLAQDIFPQTPNSPGGGFALMPYYRESRRLIGLTTIREQDILPASEDGSRVAALPVNEKGQ